MMDMTKEYPYPEGEGKVKWVSTGWLGENLHDEDLQIIDTQPNVHDYIQEHIPGAIYMCEGLVRAPLGGRPAVYAPEDALQSVFRRIGIRPDVPVVVYTGKGPFKGWGDGLEQTMVSYSLARFGHDRVYTLDGGIEKWKAEEREVTKVFPELRGSDFKVEARQEYAIDYEEFRGIKDNDDVVLLDARPKDVYEGQGPWIKPGHIPGAVNLPWKALMDGDNPRLLKPDKEINRLLEAHRVSKDKTILCSCGTGREATNEFNLLKWYLGYPKVRIYEGSFTEWSSYPDNPTVTGPDPR